MISSWELTMFSLAGSCLLFALVVSWVSYILFGWYPEAIFLRALHIAVVFRSPLLSSYRLMLFLIFIWSLKSLSRSLFLVSRLILEQSICEFDVFLFDSFKLLNAFIKHSSCYLISKIECVWVIPAELKIVIWLR